MLVLSRKIGEAIIINDTIRVTVVDIGQGRVKIGVLAPDHVSVDREEIHDKKRSERQFRDSDEDAIPIMHNRIAQMSDTASKTPAPSPKIQNTDFRKKSR